MKRFFLITLLLAACLAAAPLLLAQTPPAGDKSQQNTPPAAPAPPANSSANPFPTDTSSVPVLPSTSTPAQPEGSNSNAASPFLMVTSEEQDPVRSPDDPEPEGNTDTQDYSSSQTGLERLLPNPNDDLPGKKKGVKEPTHQEAASKDIEIGHYYLDRKNWKAALSRFESAMVLDPENPEVYWGLAEAQHHMGDLANAKANYLKVLDYDPDGPHGKQARRELKDPALAKAPDAAQGQAAPESQK